MGQQKKRKESHHTERKAALTGLGAKIDGLDVVIASLMAEQHTLKRTRGYILSTHDIATGSPNDNNASSTSALKIPMRLTYPSPFRHAKNALPRLRQEVLIRNAMDREKSSSPPGSLGLLSSDEFEASSPDRNVLRGNNDGNANGCGGDIDGKGDVRMSIEGMSSSVAENHFALSPTKIANPSTRSSAPSPVSEISAPGSSSRNGQGAHWQAKQVTKRKLQDKAAKAREVRMRRLSGTSSAVV